MTHPHYKETEFGFEYGPIRVERTCSDNKRGWALLTVRTPKMKMELYVTRTGEITIRVPKGKVVKMEAI